MAKGKSCPPKESKKPKGMGAKKGKKGAAMPMPMKPKMMNDYA